MGSGNGWASGVNVSNFVVEKLQYDDDSHNYISWREQMLCLLESQGLLGHINKVMKEKDEEESWRKNDSVVKGWILGALSTELRQAYMSCLSPRDGCSLKSSVTARDVWSGLQSKFNLEESTPPSSPPTARDFLDKFDKKLDELRQKFASKTQEPGGVNVSNFVRAELQYDEDSNNYISWREQMLCLVESQGLLKHINVGEMEEKDESWRKDDRVVKGWILGALSNDLVEECVDSFEARDDHSLTSSVTARDVWLELESMFVSEEHTPPSPLQTEIDVFEEIAKEMYEIKKLMESQSPDDQAQEAGGREKNETFKSGIPWFTRKQMKDHEPKLKLKLDMYKAASKGQWHKAIKVLKIFKQSENPEDSIKPILKDANRTLVPVAVKAGKDARKFLEKVVGMMSEDELRFQDETGANALHLAAAEGNITAATILVGKGPVFQHDIMHAKNKKKELPIHVAAKYANKRVLHFLSLSTTMGDDDRLLLLFYLIDADFYDMASQLVREYPEIGKMKLKIKEIGSSAPQESNVANPQETLMKNKQKETIKSVDDPGSTSTPALAPAPREDDKTSALERLCERDSAFLSGSPLNCWQRLLCFCFQRVNMKSEATPDVDNDNTAQLPSVLPWLKKANILHLMKEKFMDHIRGIKNKRLIHQQAIDLVKQLCVIVESLNEKERDSIYSDCMDTAARLGILEVIEAIEEINPNATSLRNKDGRCFYQVAALHRSEKVVNLIFKGSDHKKNRYSYQKDINGNTLLHLAADLAPSHKLNRVASAALQMQRELKWFQEIKQYVHPSARNLKNKAGKTAQMVFTERHKRLKEEGEKWMKDTAQSCIIVASLIATVVFAAAITVPGGNNSNTGFPMFKDTEAFIIFAVSDAVSLFTSVTSLLMFLSIMTSRYAENDFLHALPTRLCIGLITLFLSILFMMTAFSATIHLVFPRKHGWVLTTVILLACAPVLAFARLQAPLLRHFVSSTYCGRILRHKTRRCCFT